MIYKGRHRPIVQLISLDLEQSVRSVWFVRVACFNAIDLQRTNHTLPTDCSKSSEINCTSWLHHSAARSLRDVTYTKPASVY